MHTLSYFSEGFLSTFRNLFTYQWRDLRACSKKLGIHIFSLGQKRFFLYQADFVLYPQSLHPRWLHNLYTEGLTVSFTSFCGFQGQNEREGFYFFPPEYCTLQLFYEYVKIFLKWEIYSYFLLLFVDAEKDGKTPHKLRMPLLHAYCSLCMHNLLQKAETSVNSKTLPRQMESTVLWLPEEYIARLNLSFPAEQYHCLLSIPHPSHRNEWADINRK